MPTLFGRVEAIVVGTSVLERNLSGKIPEKRRNNLRKLEYEQKMAVSREKNGHCLFWLGYLDSNQE